MDEPERAAPYRLDELGSLQFAQLCETLLELEAGISLGPWSGESSWHATADIPHGLVAPLEGTPLPGPTLVVACWLPPRRYVPTVEWRTAETVAIAMAAAQSGTRSALLLLNRSLDDISIAQECQGLFPAGVAVLGPPEIGAVLDASPELRFRAPFTLGVRKLGDLIPDALREASAADVDAATELARAFVPTRAYAQALESLRRHHFAVLTGPPEMGKTAIARMISLAAMTAGWEAHECVRPDELWHAFARDRAQIFVADDAFGSTEYRPDAAERWALELDRVLRAMDARHWLIWTSRPAPLNAGLRRIHREHGVERWPQPAEVGVDAADLDVAEKALILFRHAKAAHLSTEAVAIVQTHGFEIVAHPHFTPERIRRFVADRLPGLAAMTRADDLVAAAVREEIREPTSAMAASFNGLELEYRTVLVALLDVPPGLVPERELIASVRRHGDGGMHQAPHELVEQLTDHFVRIVPRAGVTWVHPSWRDLVIDQLVRDATARRRFLERCGLEGLLLAVSVGGGARGERRYPLLVDDGDWDTASDRLADLVAELDDSRTFRLLAAVTAASDAASSYRERSEIRPLVGRTLEHVRADWDASRAPVPAGLLRLWFELATRVTEPPEAPKIAPTWIELLPTSAVDVQELSELSRLDDWSALAGILAVHAPATLDAFGFPDRQAPILRQLVADARLVRRAPEAAELLARILRRLARLAPGLEPDARVAVARLAARHLASLVPEPEEPSRFRLRAREPDRDLVARILADLEAGGPTTPGPYMPIEW